MSRALRSMALWLGLLSAEPMLATTDGAYGAPGDGSAQGKSVMGTPVLRRWTLDSGGTSAATGGNFRLGASVGQPDAALVSAGPYRLSAGFWAPQGGNLGDSLFADGFEGP